MSESFSSSHHVLLFGHINTCWFPFQAIYLSLALCLVVLPLWTPLAGKSAPGIHNQKYHQKLPSTLHVQKNWFAVGALGIQTAVAKIWPASSDILCEWKTYFFPNSALWSNFLATKTWCFQFRKERWMEATQTEQSHIVFFTVSFNNWN